MLLPRFDDEDDYKEENWSLALGNLTAKKMFILEIGLEKKCKLSSSAHNFSWRNALSIRKLWASFTISFYLKMCFCPSTYEIQSSGSKMKMAQNMSFMYLFENIYLLKQKYDYMASHYRCLLSGNFEWSLKLLRVVKPKW